MLPGVPDSWHRPERRKDTGEITSLSVHSRMAGTLRGQLAKDPEHPHPNSRSLTHISKLPDKGAVPSKESKEVQYDIEPIAPLDASLQA